MPSTLNGFKTSCLMANLFDIIELNCDNNNAMSCGLRKGELNDNGIFLKLLNALNFAEK